MRIAAYSTELSNIKIIPITDKPKIKHRLWTFKIGNWEERLINSGVKKVNKDIKKSLNYNKKCSFYVYTLCAMGGIKNYFNYKDKKNLFVFMDMYYYIK